MGFRGESRCGDWVAVLDGSEDLLLHRGAAARRGHRPAGHGVVLGSEPAPLRSAAGLSQPGGRGAAAAQLWARVLRQAGALEEDGRLSLLAQARHIGHIGYRRR